MITKTFSINHVEETINVKWCVSKVPQYVLGLIETVVLSTHNI